MRDYKPSLPYTTPAELINSDGIEVIKGVERNKYPETGEEIFCSYKSFGGTEIEKNGILSVLDTATVETWYRPDIIASSRLKIGGRLYQVLGTPENINMRNQFCVFKVQAVRGGA